MDRVILHSDMNSCYASIELLHHPEWRGRPLAVGGDPETRHGIVLAKEQLAKKAGVKTGMALWEARQVCPDILFVPPHYDLYLRFSRLAHSIYGEYTDRQEAFGIDESWLDCTESTACRGDGMAIAQEINRRVREELGITVSIGVSWNKVFAKFGSDYKKPDAVTEVNRENYKTIVWQQPVEELLYVGPATKEKLWRCGVRTIGQLAQTDPAILQRLLGKMGLVLSVFARGEDRTPVSLEQEEAPIKSIGNSMTMPRDLTTDEEVRMSIFMLSESVATRLKEHGFAGDVIEVWVRDNDLDGFQRQHKIAVPTNISDEIARTAVELFSEGYRWRKPVRAVGVRVSDLKGENVPYQLNLFLDEEYRRKQRQMDMAVDEIRRRFGTDSVQRGLMRFGPEITPRKRQEQTIHPVSYMERGNRTGVN